MIDSVGVCTRPTVVRKKPPSRELNAVIARVPLMPTSQSASERQRAASASGSICSSLRRCSKPSRIAAGVMLCSHSRLHRLLAPCACCWIRRKISSPSRPGVAGVDQLAHVLALDQPDDRVEARLGLVDRRQLEVRRDHRQVREAPLAALDVELLRRLDLEQVADRRGDDVARRSRSTRRACRTCRRRGVSARTMSCATDGFSAMISDLLMVPLQSSFSATAQPHPYNPAFSRARAHARAPMNSMYPKKPMPQASARQQPRRTRRAPAAAASRCAAPACTARACSRCAPIAKGETHHRIHRRGHHLEGGAAPPSARPERPEPHLLLPHRRQARHRRQVRRQRGEVDQPRVPAELRGRRRRRPRLHQGAARIKPGEELNYDYGLIIDGATRRR